MPYARRPRYSRRRTTSHRRPRRGVKSVVRRSRYRKSALAQSRQIRTTARSVMRLRKRVLEDATAVSRWQIKISNVDLDTDNGTGKANSKGIIVLPLTSLTAVGDNAATSSIDPAPSTKYMTWQQVQPAIGETGTNASDKTAPAFIRVYNQRVRMCFHQNDMNRVCRFEMFVVRLATNHETQSKNFTQQAQNNIDGVTFNGCPSGSTRFNNGEDYYASSGWNGILPGAAGQPPILPGATDLLGYDLVRMNNQRYKVVHHRSFVLGRTVNPAYPSTPQSGSSATPAALAPIDARDYYECAFTINYGGAKFMPFDEDGVQANAANITINDIKYSELDRHKKHWIVIFPSRDCSTSGQKGIPNFSLVADMTCRVPT